MTPEEVSAQLREVADERHRQALAIVEPLDLAQTTWGEYPHHNIVNAITYAARRGLHRYLDRHAAALRSELAHRHRVPEERLVVGDGAAHQLSAATQTLLAAFPRLLVFRTFSKAWGLAGLRCGYTIGGPGSEPLLERLEPELGLNELAQAGALEALRSSETRVTLRAATIATNRVTLTATARGFGYEVTDSHANFLWIALPKVDGAELYARLERGHVIVAGGGPVGEP